MDFPFSLRCDRAKTQSVLDAMVAALWVIALFIVCSRVALSYPQHDVFVTYADAGRKWIELQPLYSTTRGFVYSPLIAGCFAALSWLPARHGAVLWRLLNAAAFCCAIAWWLKVGLHNRIPRRSFWLVFLLVLPLAI